MKLKGAATVVDVVDVGQCETEERLTQGGDATREGNWTTHPLVRQLLQFLWHVRTNILSSSSVSWLYNASHPIMRAMVSRLKCSPYQYSWNFAAV